MCWVPNMRQIHIWCIFSMCLACIQCMFNFFLLDALHLLHVFRCQLPWCPLGRNPKHTRRQHSLHLLGTILTYTKWILWKWTEKHVGVSLHLMGSIIFQQPTQSVTRNSSSTNWTILFGLLIQSSCFEIFYHIKTVLWDQQDSSICTAGIPCHWLCRLLKNNWAH